jgi:hypothetical protein
MAEPTPELIVSAKDEISWVPVTELEIERAPTAAKGNTASGEDGLPTLVWKKVWKYISDVATKIFTAFINLGYYLGSGK